MLIKIISYSWGGTIFSKIKNDLYIASCVGQFFYGRNGKYTNYIALKKCFQTVEQKSRELMLSVCLPYKIGCNLAGGDWKIVKELIKENISNSIICRKEI